LSRYLIPFSVLLVVLLTLTMRAKNSNQDLRPFLGKWSGEFKPESFRTGQGSEEDLRRSRLEGYIQVYATNRKFKMHLEGEQQAIDVTGTWTFEEKKLNLTPLDVQIDDQGGEEMRDPNKKYIPADAVRATYSKPLSFRLGGDGKTLQGLPISLGEMIGSHRLEKDGF
jgi:hypothetical protein